MRRRSPVSVVVGRLSANSPMIASAWSGQLVRNSRATRPAACMPAAAASSSVCRHCPRAAGTCPARTQALAASIR